MKKMNKSKISQDESKTVHDESKMAMITIAISSRALFDLEKENEIFIDKGAEKYYEYQVKNKDKSLKTSGAFPLIQALLHFDKKHFEKYGQKLIEVMIVSKNSPEAGIRIFNSIQEHRLDITRAAFLGGDEPGPYLKAFGIDLYLSKERDSVSMSLQHGIASAVVHYDNDSKNQDLTKTFKEVRIALDADNVIFSGESEKIFEKEGIKGFVANEERQVREELKDGPFARLVRAFAKINKMYEDEGPPPIKLALVTARSSGAPLKRVLGTLEKWGVKMDKAFFLGTFPKNIVLDQFKPHFFFDDKDENIKKSQKSTPSGKVPI